MSFYFHTENMKNYEHDRSNFLGIFSSVMKTKSWSTGTDISFSLAFVVSFSISFRNKKRKISSIEIFHNDFFAFYERIKWENYHQRFWGSNFIILILLSSILIKILISKSSK